MRILVLIFCSFLFSCQSKLDKPYDEKMKSCLTNELANKAIVVKYEQQDGLSSEKDGIKYYVGYFNAEIKFVANYNNLYTAGQKYKIVKGIISFMKTENGWNCQSFDLSASTLIKIKDEGDNNTHISSSNSDLPNSAIDSSKEINSNNVLAQYLSNYGQEYSGFCNDAPIRIKLMWNKDKTMNGVFYFTNKQNQLYVLTGNNYTDGVLQLELFSDNKKQALGEFRKSLDANFINWNGVLTSTTSNITYNFTIKRPR